MKFGIDNYESFAGKHVLLTGGSRGIGKTIRNHFESLGALVEAPCRDEMDLLSRESIDRYLVQRGDKPVDILIHCAGLNVLNGNGQLSMDAMDKCFQVNLFSAAQIIEYLEPMMISRKNGRIVFISSLYAIVSREGRCAYSASKNALTGLIRTLALELGPHGILVNGVAPGYVLTDMTRRNLSESELDTIRSAMATGRFQEEEEISNLTAFLCSVYNQSITGQLIPVDGGYLCR